MTFVKRILMAGVLSLVGAAFIAGPASAHKGKGHKAEMRGISATNLINAAAVELGVTPQVLTTAIVNAANSEIDDLLADEDITAEKATKMKAKVASNIVRAIKLSRTRVVAANLGVTTQVLNQEFRDARRALAGARIDKALADGRISAEQATELRARLAAAVLPGYAPRFGFCFRVDGLKHGRFGKKHS